MSGQISLVPTTLPPGLYQQAGGNPSSNQGSVRSHMTGNSGSFSPLSNVFPQSRGNIQPQYTGQSQLLQPDHTGFNATSPRPPVLPARPSPSGYGSPPFVPQRNGHVAQWDVSPSDKATSDRFFDELDPQRRGYIEGDVAVPFMVKSSLPGEELAHIWYERLSRLMTCSSHLITTPGILRTSTTMENSREMDSQLRCT